MSAPVRMVCARCGSENVVGDCFAEWNVEAQKWEVRGGSIFDGGSYCDDCDGECDIDEAPLEAQPVPAIRNVDADPRELYLG